MGSCLRKEERRVLLLGLDNSGKSTIRSFQVPDPVPSSSFILPTLGFDVDTVITPDGSFEFAVYDLAGQHLFRSLWPQFYKGAHAILFVVDSSDPDRFQEAKLELSRLLTRDIPLLVLANKRDLPQCVSVDELRQILGLMNTKIPIYETSGLTGAGVREVITSLPRDIADFKKKKKKKKAK